MVQQDLSEGSKSYHEEARIYERFSQTQDAPGKILDLLLPLIANREVLDIGCGTGKYLVKLAPYATKIIGLDVSEDQLRIARSKLKGVGNVDLICSSAESIDLPDEGIDTIISSWVFGTILDVNRRAKALSEARRVLRKHGMIYLVENDLYGDFEYIRGIYPDYSYTHEYNHWLEKQGFAPHSRFSTHFEFKDLEEAKMIFKSIWGGDVANRVHNRIITHNIIIYMQEKK
jgi:ubiquinone/menaquinone biosynthesis C-methylase UbiE